MDVPQPSVSLEKLWVKIIFMLKSVCTKHESSLDCQIAVGRWLRGEASSLRSSHLQVHCLKSYSQVCHHGRELVKEAVVALVPGNVCPMCSPLVIWNASLRNNIAVHRLWVSYDIDFRDSFMNDVCLRWKHWKCRTCSFSLTQYSFSPMLV